MSPVQQLLVMVKETLTPAPDGVTQIFFTSREYKPGSVSVWWNGIRAIKEWEDGFEELGGKRIYMKEAPLTNDALQVQYEPR